MLGAVPKTSNPSRRVRRRRRGWEERRERGERVRECFAYLVRELQRMLSRSFLPARDVYAACFESVLAPESC